MNYSLYLLQSSLKFSDFKVPLLGYVTAFVVTLILIPPVLLIVKKFKLFDRPNARKVHTEPKPTFGGIAILAGTFISLLIWYKFPEHPSIITFLLSVAVLMIVGIMDDLKDLAVRYKLIIQVGVATLLAVSGIRISSFGGLFGVGELHLAAQYTITVLTIVGIINAFNFIDGIDGLAGGMGFMSLITLGLFLNLSDDPGFALMSFALAGSLLAFLYFNFNPARIFMGDTGSLALGLIISVLCIQLMKRNAIAPVPIVPNIYIFTLGLVMIPVFDTLRVFGARLWKGQSPFSPDKTHIHHLITKEGFSHGFATRIICVIHAFILILVYWMKNLQPEFQLLVLIVIMVVLIFLFRNISWLKKFIKPDKKTSVHQSSL